MNKLLVLTFVILSSLNVNSQVVNLSIDSILKDDAIQKFVNNLDENVRDLIKQEKADSVLALCIVPDYYVAAYFATVFWKKSGKCRSFVLFQKDIPNGKILRKETNNDTLNSIQIDYYHNYFKNRPVELPDSLPVSHRNLIYAQFFFRSNREAYMEYANEVYNIFPNDFHLAFINESLKIYYAEF